MKIWNKLSGFISNLHTSESKELHSEESESFSVRNMLIHGMDHFRSLGSLFLLELEETAEKARVKLVRLLIAAGLLIVGYLILCVFLIALISLWLGFVWASAIVGAIHLIAGGILLYAGIKVKLTPILPATLEEINTDYTCLQIVIKANRNY